MSLIHHTPGRVRLNVTGLQNQRRLASAVEQPIRQPDRIKLVQPNTITGSPLIHYSPRGEQKKALLSALRNINRQFGLTPIDSIDNITDAKPRPAPSPHGDALIATMVGMVIEKARER